MFEDELNEVERALNECEEKLNEELEDFKRQVDEAVTKYREKYEKAIKDIAHSRLLLKLLREDENDASDDSLS